MSFPLFLTFRIKRLGLISIIFILFARFLGLRKLFCCFLPLLRAHPLVVQHTQAGHTVDHIQSVIGKFRHWVAAETEHFHLGQRRERVEVTEVCHAVARHD